MASNYDAIRADNIRRYGEETHHLSFLGRLYPDRTHFIFELLQNAEDEGASKIRFDLLQDRLEVRHDGCPFDEDDVRGICGVGEGTKAEDLTQIGKFGIGFKSVYAYTTAPEVHSGDEHFRIEYYVRPHQAASKHPGDTWTTLFVFPFDISDRAPTICQNEIAGRLRNLKARTLLFLRNMGEIEYTLPDHSGGTYLREVTQRGIAKQVLVIGQNNGVEEDETWVVFERPVPIPNSCRQVSVEIGFKLERVADGQTERIAKINDSDLFVYFPTEKSTRFGFLVQGPYRTTPARDNIPKDDAWNATLVDETATLITESLHHMKKMGLLTVSLLETLPIRSIDFPQDGMFNPIVEAVRDSLMEQDLLPAEDRTFVSARNARMTRSTDLRKLLSHDHLRVLLQTSDEVKWLSGEITQDRTPDLREFLSNKLSVADVEPPSFAGLVSADFLNGLDDEWFASFYGFLDNQKSLWQPPRGVLRSKPIIRLENGSLVVPFDGSGNPNAYLPVEHKVGFASVRRTIVSYQPALDFLKRLGLTQPDEIADVVEYVLPKYRSSERENVSEEQYLADLQSIFGAMKTDSEQKKRQLLEQVRSTPFVQAVNAATGEQGYRRPDEVYLPTPALRVFFEDNSGAWFLPDSSDTLANVWKELGAASLPRRIVHSRKPATVTEYSNWVPEITNYDLEGLHHYLDRLAQMPAQSEPAVQRGVVLWQILVNCHREKAGFFDGTYKWFYYRWKTKTFASDFQVLLQSRAWVPTIGGQCKIPSECCVDELHPDLDQDDKLLKTLGVRPSEHESRTKLLTDLRAYGYDEEYLRVLELLRQHPDEIGRLTQRLVSLEYPPGSRANPRFPTRPSRNPERREKGVTKEVLDAPDKKYEPQPRSVRTTRPGIDQNVWLRSHYTNDDHQLVCQICKLEMPFKKRDGEYYFEAVEALTRDHLPKEYEAQFLALCPLCAAKYAEFVKRDVVAMERVKNALLESEEPEIPLELGDLKTSLKFVETHFQDLKTILGLVRGTDVENEDGFE